MMAGLSEPISVGQWFRVVTGVIEVAGATALFHPRCGSLRCSRARDGLRH